MRKFRGIAVKAVACAWLAAFAGAAYAGPPAQRHPHIFTPSCAAPPRCAGHTCLRMGRCALGSHTQPMGCLIYACKPGAR